MSYQDIEPEDLDRVVARDGLRIIDVREPHEFYGELGHIDGAELVPLRELAATATSWNPGSALLVVCRSGGRSGQAAAYLASVGFSRVVNLRGGMMAYRELESRAA